MPLANHANDIAGAIDDHGKEVHNVAAEYAHVESVGLSEAGEGILGKQWWLRRRAANEWRRNGDRGSSPPTPPS